MAWLDAMSPKVRSAVVSGFWGRLPHSEHFAAAPTDPDEIDVISDVLEQAGGILTQLTAGVIHPAYQVVEDYVCYPGTARLTPSLLPLRKVVALQVVEDDEGLAVSLDGVVTHGDSVRFTAADNTVAAGADWLDLGRLWFLQMACACPALLRLRLTYNAGSTITASARQAVISLAHEMYLQVAPCDECGTCRLPQRTTSVTREGISFNVGDPLDATGSAMGATGLPDVDMWLRGVNPRQATQRSAVYTADAPPPVVQSLVMARPTFPPLLNGRVVGAATISAQGVVT